MEIIAKEFIFMNKNPTIELHIKLRCSEITNSKDIRESFTDDDLQDEIQSLLLSWMFLLKTILKLC